MKYLSFILAVIYISVVQVTVVGSEVEKAPEFEVVPIVENIASSDVVDAEVSRSLGIETTAGELQLVVDGEGTNLYQIVDNELVLVGESTLEEFEEVKSKGNYLLVNDGKVIASSNGIVATLGGSDVIVDMYPSLDDMEQKLPISGASMDGSYHYTVKSGENYFVNVTLGGVNGFINVDDVQVIPSHLVKAQTHFKNVAGVWTQFIAIDPLNSTEYEVLELGDALEGSVEGREYLQGENNEFFLKDSRTRSVAVSGETYFQNLPFRSRSNYTAADFKSYLGSVNMTNSGYYNATNSFIEAQDIYGVNALLLFAMANHEGFYGTSTLSLKCNNFFGRGAYDYNPENACVSYGFTDARSGILAQGSFLNSEYLDNEDYRYGGAHAGNKSSGMNVYYASDINWGNKLASHAYRIDKFLGGKENNKYRVIEMLNEVRIYQDQAMSKPLNYVFSDGKVINYVTTRNAIDKVDAKTVTNPRFVVVQETDTALKIQLDTPLSFGNATTVDWTQATKGSYPNFNGTMKIKVAPNSASAHVKYGDYLKQQMWIPKKQNGAVTYRVLSQGTQVTPPATSTYKYDYYPSGKVKTKFSINNEGFLEGAISYTEKGQVTKRYSYYPKTVYGNHAKRIKYVYYIDSNGYIKLAREYRDNSKTIIKVYEYASKTVYGEDHGSKIVTIFYLENGFIKNAHVKSKGKIVKIFEYAPNTKFGDNHYQKRTEVFTMNGNYIKYSETFKNGTLINIKEYASSTKYGSHKDKVKFSFTIEKGNITGAKLLSGSKVRSYYEYYPNTKYGKNHGKMISAIFTMKGNVIDFATVREKGTGKVTNYFQYESNTSYDKTGGSHYKKRKYVFDIDKNTQYIIRAHGFKNQVRTNVYEYQPKTKFNQNHGKRIKYNFSVKNGNIVTQALQYDNNYIKISKYDYYSNAIYNETHGCKISAKTTYDRYGKVTGKTNYPKKECTAKNSIVDYNVHGESINLKYNNTFGHKILLDGSSDYVVTTGTKMDQGINMNKMKEGIYQLVDGGKNVRSENRISQEFYSITRNKKNYKLRLYTDGNKNVKISKTKASLPSNYCDIMIDPGHGGNDGGARGAGAKSEKIVNLELSNKLKYELDQMGYKTCMTRTNDTTLSTYGKNSRTGKSYEKQANIYVSVHHNAANSRAKGYQLYTSVQTTNTLGTSIGNKWNQIDRYNPQSGTMGYQSGTTGVHKRVLTHENVVGTNLPKGGDYYFMIREIGSRATKAVSSSNPYRNDRFGSESILIEAGYIDNKQEYDKLSNSAHQLKEAKVMSEGIHNYVNSR